MTQDNPDGLSAARKRHLRESTYTLSGSNLLVMMYSALAGDEPYEVLDFLENTAGLTDGYPSVSSDGGEP